MLILNCGGTFNKRYNKISGKLEVPYDNLALEKILESASCKYSLSGVVYKDSLDIDSQDRKIIANIIMESTEKNFILVHGTDTMDQTAEFLNEVFDDRIIILTGAMKPFEVESLEATLNLGIAIGFLNGNSVNGVYITMNGLVEKFDMIKKNRDIGKFESVR